MVGAPQGPQSPWGRTRWRVLGWKEALFCGRVWHCKELLFFFLRIVSAWNQSRVKRAMGILEFLGGAPRILGGQLRRTSVCQPVSGGPQVEARKPRKVLRNTQVSCGWGFFESRNLECLSRNDFDSKQNQTTPNKNRARCVGPLKNLCSAYQACHALPVGTHDAHNKKS